MFKRRELEGSNMWKILYLIKCDFVEVISVNKEIKFSSSVKNKEILENLSVCYFPKKKYYFQVRHAISCSDVKQHNILTLYFFVKYSKLVSKL